MSNAVTAASVAAIEAGAGLEDVDNLSRGNSDLDIVTDVPEGEHIPMGEEFSVDMNDTPEYSIPSANETSVAAMYDGAVALAYGEDPVEAFQQSKDKNNPEVIGQDRVAQAQAEASGELNELILEASSQGLTLDPKAMAEKAADVANLHEGSFAYQRAVIEQLPKSDMLSKELKETLAARLAITQELGRLVDEEVSWSWDTTGDVLGLIALSDESWNTAAMMKQVYGDEGSASEAFLHSTDAILGLGRTLQSLPPEDQVTFFKALKSTFPEVEDNDLQRIIFLSDVMQSGDFSQRDIGNLQSGFELDRAGILLDVAGIGGAMRLGKLAKAIGQHNNVMNVVAAADEVETAAKISKISMNPEGATSTGVSPLNAAAAIDPTYSADMAKISKGVPQEKQAQIKREFDKTDELLERGLDVADEGLGLTDAEKAARNKSIEDELMARPDVANVTVETLDNRTAKIVFDVVDGEGNKIARGTEKRAYTIDDIGEYTEAKSGPLKVIGKFVMSPNALLTGKIGEGLVNAFERIGFQRSKVESGFSKAFLNVNKGLSTKENLRVQQVLAKGNVEGKEYSWHELVDVGLDAGAFKLTDKEAIAYLGNRRLLRQMGAVKNQQLVQDANAKGIRQFDLDGVQHHGKEYSTAQAASTAFRQASTSGKKIGIQDQGKFVNNTRADSVDLKEWYEKGYKLIRAQDVPFQKGGIAVDWMLVKGSKKVNGQLLNMRPGYVPQIREGATWFIKEVKDVALDGGAATRQRLVTHRYTNNFQEAEEIQRVMQADMPDRKFEILFDKDMPQSAVDQDMISQAGGLITGGRSEIIREGLEGNKGDFKSPLEAIQESISHIGRHMTGSTYRMGMRQKFVNTAKDWGALPEGFRGGFHEAIKAIDEGAASPELKRTLRNMHKQISFVSGIPSGLEQKYRAIKISIGKSLEQVPGASTKLGRHLVEKGFYDNSTSAVDKARSMAFTFGLGMFNPAQALIQASGMALAALANPMSFAKGFQHSLSAGILDLAISRSPEVGRSLAKSLDKLGIGVDAEAYKIWKQSGIKESILRANDDYRAFFEGLPTSGSVAGQVLQKAGGMATNVAHKGTTFFTAGEYTAARQAFFTAVEWYKGQKGAKALNTEEARKAILQRTESYRLHMSRANTAEFQKGLAGVAFQYKQVMTKFTEALIGANERGFTAADRGRIVAGSALLYGANGVPFLDLASNQIMEMLGIDAETTSEEDLITIKQGLVGRLIDAPHNVDFSSRVALGAELGTSVKDFLINPMDHPLALVAGPFGNLADKTFRGMNDTFLAMNAAYKIDDESIPWNTRLHAVAGVLGGSLAQLPSSTRNALASYVTAESGYYRNANGQEVIPALNFEESTQFWNALGFQPSEKREFYELGAEEQLRVKQLAARSAPELVVSLLAKMTDVGVDEAIAYRLAAAATLDSFQGKERREIEEKILQRLAKPASAWDTKLSNTLADWEGTLISANDKTNTAIARLLDETRGEE